MRANSALHAAADEASRQAANRERLEDQLRQSQKMEALGQLTGGIAHDFNNMLAIVVGSIDIVQRRLSRGQQDVGRYLESAMDGARRAATLTQRLLAFSRQQPLVPAVIDANTLVGTMAELLRRTIGERIRLETIQAGGLWRTSVDAPQVEQAIVNLAVNARDAMEDGGRLTIETFNVSLDESYADGHMEVPPGQYVVIAVSDNGAGMSADVVEKAYEPFFTTKPVGKGTGLGLSQVFGFIKQSGGHVKIYSELGHGTTVKMYLPRYRGEELPKSSPKLGAAAETPLGTPNELVVVVEDEDGVRRMTVDALRELGYTVVHASDGKQGLLEIEKLTGVKLLLTDIVMPDMNGRKLAEEVNKRFPDIKILYATGYAPNAVIHDGKLDSDVNLLSKPYTVQQLATKVRTVLDASRNEKSFEA